MSDPLSIEPATPDDLPLILSLIRELAEYERAPHAVEATEEILGEALFGEEPGPEALIARQDGEPLGFALFFHNFSTWTGRRGLYLEDLFVRPSGRGRGVGRALLTRVAEIAVERNCPRFEWAVLDWNEPAIGFYEKLGARAMDEWTVYRLSGDALRELGRGR
jgi:GNAT superfamily N-acetyltransferase